MTVSLFDLRYRDLSDVAKGAMAVLAGFAGRSIARVIFLMTAGNLYGAVRLGEMASVVAVVEILIMLGIFGFRRSLLEILENTRAKQHLIYAYLFSALAVTSAVGLLLAFVLAMLWDYIGLNMKTIHYPLLSFLIPLTGLMEIFLTATRYKRRIRYEVLARSVVEPWTLATLALLFYYLGKTSYGLLASYSGALIAAFFVSLFAFGREYSWRSLAKAPFKMVFVRRVSILSSPTAVVDAIGIAFRRADILVLSLLTSDLWVGIYYGAQNIATLAQKTRYLFDPILSPVISQTMSRRGNGDTAKNLSQVCLWILMMLSFELALLVYYGEALLSTIGVGFSTGALTLIILLFAETIEATFASTELPLVFKKPWINLMLTLSGFVFYILSLAVLVPRYDIQGAGLAFLISVSALNAARLITIWKIFHIKILEVTYLKPIMVGTFTFIVLSLVGNYIDLISSWGVPLGLLLGICIYAALFVLLKPTADDREFLMYLKKQRTKNSLTLKKG